MDYKIILDPRIQDIQEGLVLSASGPKDRFSTEPPILLFVTDCTKAREHWLDIQNLVTRTASELQEENLCNIGIAIQRYADVPVEDQVMWRTAFSRYYCRKELARYGIECGF